MLNFNRLHLLPLLLSALLFSNVGKAVQFIFINADGPNEGLNDPTPVQPVGGNPGTTLGAQRLAALQRVGEIWGAYLQGNVPVRVIVEFDTLAPNILAGASPESMQQGFLNAPKGNTWYPVALANQLAGHDLEPSLSDISVTANSAGTFYYGLDKGSPDTLSSFVDVLLHELGHGLGFVSFVEPSNGDLYLNRMDIFSSFIFDKGSNLAWPAMTSAQRAASARNDPFLVWTGPFTTAGLPSRLSPSSTITSSLSAAPLAYTHAAFGGPLPRAGITRELVATDPGDACGPIVNSAALSGKIAFIRRGICDFDLKVYKAQQAGAVAVVIANNVNDGLATPSGDSLVDGIPVEITIPAVFISKADGDALLAGFPGVQLSITPVADQYYGSSGKQLRLYAPATLASGSSVSHWTLDASPNLLMEPVISPVLDRKLDLTLTQMKDIGWKVVDIPFPHLTYDSWKTEVFVPGDTLTAATDDPDGDGVSNLEEYFFGNDPKKPDVARLPTFSLGGSGAKLTYTRSKRFTDLEFAVEKSTTLEAFVTAVKGVDYEIESTQAAGVSAEQVTLRLLNPPAGKLFLRLRIHD